MPQGRKEMTPADIKRANAQDRFLMRACQAFKGNVEDVERGVRIYAARHDMDETEVQNDDKVMTKIKADQIRRCNDNIGKLQRRIATRGLAKVTPDTSLYDDDDDDVLVAVQ